MAERNRKRVFDITNGRCFYCGCELDIDNFHIDHFIAKSDGGKGKENLVPSCPECNICKSDLTIEEFREKIIALLHESFTGIVIKKYFDISGTPVKFYFEDKNNGKI